MNLEELNRNLYGPRPPSNTPPTHYNNFGEILTEYLFYNGEWFVKAFGWEYISYEPMIKTPVGEFEQLRIYKDSDFKRLPVPEHYDFKEPEYYPNKHYAGD
jgi:hypothetical protein